MDEALALIEQIIEEHKIIFQKFEKLEQVANDAGALRAVDKAKDRFMPGRFDQSQGLQMLDESVESIDEGLRAHFNREETRLVDAFEKHGSRDLSSALHTLLLEHEDIRNRLDQSKKNVAELRGGKLASHLWGASAHDMLAHITHTRKLMVAHAEIEQELLHKLRNKLLKEAKGE